MRYARFALASPAILLTAVGCGVGTAPPAALVISSVSAPTSTPLEGSVAEIAVAFNGGVAPYNVRFDFGPGVIQPAFNVGGNASPLAAQVQFKEVGATTEAYTAHITVTDSRQLSTFTEWTFTVVPKPLGDIISNLRANDDWTVSVFVADPEHDDVQLSLVSSGALTAQDDYPILITGGSGTELLSFAATDLLAGASDSIVIRASDGSGLDDFASVKLTIKGVDLDPDTLYAIPLQRHARSGEEVSVVVASGPTASPFQYLTTLGLTVPWEAEYIDDSLNPGAPGGTASDDPSDPSATLDGIWADVEPTFLQAFDGIGGFLLVQTPTLEPDSAGLLGRRLLLLGTYSVGGREIRQAGVLFNLELVFPKGESRLAFVDHHGVDRTYYEDADRQVHFWGDISNSSTGIPNSVTVE